MKQIAAVLIVFLAVGFATAQDSARVSVSTTAPVNARFEIVESTILARLTFKLDRYSGHVEQIVRTKNGDDVWQEMDVIALPSTPSTGPTYQIFSSGTLARLTFLVNTTTGQTWQIQAQTDKDGNEVTRWMPIQ